MKVCLRETMAGLSALATEDNGFGFAEHEISAPHVLTFIMNLMQVCHMEHQLFTHFFPASSEEVSSLAPLVDPL